MTETSEETADTLFLVDGQPLTPCDAVAAIIVVDGRYLLQLRDTRPGIFYPNHWGLFGGGMEPGETESDTLVRELHEELELVVDKQDIARFTCFTFDFAFAGGRPLIRAFYEVPLEASRLQQLTVGEGSEMRLMSAAEALRPDRNVAPYDAFALWMHASRERIRCADQGVE